MSEREKEEEVLYLHESMFAFFLYPRTSKRTCIHGMKGEEGEISNIEKVLIGHTNVIAMTGESAVESIIGKPSCLHARSWSTTNSTRRPTPGTR